MPGDGEDCPEDGCLGLSFLEGEVVVELDQAVRDRVSAVLELPQQGEDHPLYRDVLLEKLDAILEKASGCWSGDIGGWRDSSFAQRGGRQ